MEEWCRENSSHCFPYPDKLTREKLKLESVVLEILSLGHDTNKMFQSRMEVFDSDFEQNLKSLSEICQFAKKYLKDLCS